MDQDRVFDAIEMFDKYRQVMFIQQRTIYQHLKYEISPSDKVLEAGCGIGLGTAILATSDCSITGTDKIKKNVEFAQCVYPWLDFDVWDITKPTLRSADLVVAIEVLEHVVDQPSALVNLLDVADHNVWLSVPNGTGKPFPPENPHHTREYTPQEMLDMIGPFHVDIRCWETWKKLDVDTLVDPLVYRIRKS